MSHKCHDPPTIIGQHYAVKKETAQFTQLLKYVALIYLDMNSILDHSSAISHTSCACFPSVIQKQITSCNCNLLHPCTSLLYLIMNFSISWWRIECGPH